MSERKSNYRWPATADNPFVIGLVSISDRASAGAYEDKGLPALMEWFGMALASPWRAEQRLIPDERSQIEQTLIDLAASGCHLIVTTGGTGPAQRDGHAGSHAGCGRARKMLRFLAKEDALHLRATSCRQRSCRGRLLSYAAALSSSICPVSRRRFARRSKVCAMPMASSPSKASSQLFLIAST